MVGPLFWVSVIGGVAVVIGIVVWTAMLRRGRRLGTTGLVQRSRLTCPKCGQPFDYDYVVGASFSAVRLGTSRYMSCPLCHKWSVFDLYGTMVPRTPSPPDRPPPLP
jgi:hypothetical protein